MRPRRWVVYPAPESDSFHSGARRSDVAALDLYLRLRASGRLQEIDAGDHAALHRLPDPRLKIVEPAYPQRHFSLRQSVAGSDRHVTFGVRAFPIGAFDRAAQRSVAGALKRHGKLQRGAVQAASPIHAPCRRAGEPLQTRRQRDRSARESFGRDITLGVGDQLQIVSCPSHPALSFDLARNRRRENGEIR